MKENMSDISQKSYIDSMITNIPNVSSFHQDYILNNKVTIGKQEFIHTLDSENMEYKIQSVNVVRDHDLWKFLFSIEVEMSSFSDKDVSIMMSVYGEDPVYIKFKNKEDESLFLLSFKGYKPL